MNSKIPTCFPATNSDRYNFILGRTFDRQIRAVVALDGRVDEERLARAVRLTMDAEPVLGCRLTDIRRLCWRRREDLETGSFCSVEPAADTDGALRRLIAEPYDPFVDPLIAVKVLRGAADTLVLRVDHTVADGGGTKEVLYLLVAIYRRLAQDPGYRPVPNTRGDRSFRQVFRAAGLKEKLRMLKAFPSPAPAAIFPYRNPDRNDRAAAVRRIGPETFRKIKAYGRERRATVNDVLLAAFYRTLFRFVPHDPAVPFPVNVPVDLRPFTKQKRAGAVANLTGGYFPAVIPAECTDFEQTLRAVQAAMAWWKSSGIRLGRSVLFDVRGLRPDLDFFRRMTAPQYDFSERTGRIVPVLTNLGILDREKLAFGDSETVDAYIAGPVVFPPYFTVCVSTFGETMTLMAGYCRERDGEQPVEEFMDWMAEELFRQAAL